MSMSKRTINHRAFALLLTIVIMCCFVTSCRNAPSITSKDEPATAPKSAPAIAMTVAPMPTTQVTPIPTEPEKPLNPIVFLAALIEQYEGDSRYALLSNIVPVFSRFGLDVSILEYYKSLRVGDDDPGVFFSEEDIIVQTLSAGLDGEIVTYALLRLDIGGDGLALIFAREVAAVDWLFVDWFPCAEVGFTDDEVSFEQVWDNTEQYMYNWFLRVRGRRDHGTERQSIQTDWYDLTNKRYVLGYMSEMIAMWGDKDNWLGNIITSTENLVIENGTASLTVDYSGMLLDRKDSSDWDDIKSVAFYTHDWQIVYTRDERGSFTIDNERDRDRMWPISLDNHDYFKSGSKPANDLLVLFPDMQDAMEKNGSRAQQSALSKLLFSARRD